MRPRRQASRMTRPLKAFDFLRERARTARSFTRQELESHSGWKPNSVTTYLGKNLRDFIVDRDVDRLGVLPDFMRLTREQFLELMTQKRHVFTAYERERHEEVIMFEFLLPLTRETQLRRSLDELFYRDTVERRLREIGLPQIERIVPRSTGDNDAEFVARLCDLVAAKFGGYSISFVNGRFRKGETLLTRTEAGKRFAEDVPYLIDETTAIVRFIVPCRTAFTAYRDDVDSIEEALGVVKSTDDKAIADELRETRSLFFHIFVEAVVRTVPDEDLIWVTEVGARRRVYSYQRIPTAGER